MSAWRQARSNRSTGSSLCHHTGTRTRQNEPLAITGLHADRDLLDRRGLFDNRHAFAERPVLPRAVRVGHGEIVTRRDAGAIADTSADTEDRAGIVDRDRSHGGSP